MHMHKQQRRTKILIGSGVFLLVTSLTTDKSLLVHNRGAKAKSPTKRLFSCGYNLSVFNEEVLPEYEEVNFIASSPNVNDVLVVGLHLGCPEAIRFPGKIVYVNGESYLPDGMDKLSLKEFYLGPVAPGQGVWTQHMQLYYASIAVLTLRKAGSFEAFKQRPKGTNAGFMLYTSSRCLEHRENALRLFSEIGEVSVAGSCHGNLQNYKRVIRKGPSWETGAEIYGNYKFGLVMENSDVPGYVTEKIVSAFIGGTIPIYYGTQDVFKIFNARAFIYYNISNPESAVEQVRRLMNNSSAYREMLNEPIATWQQFQKFFSLKQGGALTYEIRAFLRI